MEEINQSADDQARKAPMFVGRPSRGDERPESSSGKLIEFDRGVIVINPLGEEKRVNLDDSYRHHGTATVKAANSVWFNEISDDSLGFFAAKEAQEKWHLTIQFEGNIGYVYLPPTISLEQYVRLVDILAIRKAFVFYFVHNGLTYDDHVYRGDDILRFIEEKNLIEKSPVEKTNKAK